MLVARSAAGGKAMARHIGEATLLNPEATYQVAGYSGIAWAYVGDETEPDEDTEWTGIEEPTGRVVMIMIGDDRRRFAFDPDECHEIPEEAYCAECGQIGCTADGR
jgi:hypothetical protein